MCGLRHIVISFAVFCAVRAAPSPAGMTAATESFLATHPGTIAMIREDRLIALYGATFASNDDPEIDTDTFVENFLVLHGDALGVDDVVLVFESKFDMPDDGLAVYTYVQHIENLPVHASVVKIPVAVGTAAEISFIGARIAAHPETPLPADVLTAEQAITVVQESAEYGHLTQFSSAEQAEASSAEFVGEYRLG